MHATYVPFHQLPSVGLPGFFRKFSCTRCTYHFTNYQVWGFLVSSGNFRARNVHTISPTTKCGASRFLQEIFVHATYVPCSTDNTGARSGSPQLPIQITRQMLAASWGEPARDIPACLLYISRLVSEKCCFVPEIII